VLLLYIPTKKYIADTVKITVMVLLLSGESKNGSANYPHEKTSHTAVFTNKVSCVFAI